MKTRMLHPVVAAVVLTALCAPALGQGPPAGDPSGLLKREAAVAEQATAPPRAAAPAAHPPAAAPGLAKRAEAPGRSTTTSGTTVAARPVGADATAASPVAVSITAAPVAVTADTTAARRAHPESTRARTVAPPRAKAPSRPVPLAVTAAVTPVSPSSTDSAVTGEAPTPAARTKRAAPKPAPAPEPFTRTITRTVSDVVEVFPVWAKVLIGALLSLLLAAAAVLGFTALRNRRLRRHREDLLAQVGVLQQALLPAVPAQVGALPVSVAYRPAAGLAAGGDFYDVFELDGGRTAIILGDVSGHGHESLGAATFIRHMVRSYLEAGMPPRAALQLAGNVLDEQRGDDFATIVAAVHDPAAGTLSYASAGHPAPIVTGPAAFEPLSVACSPPAGCGHTTGLRQTTVALPPGSTVCFFTDGLVEARVGRGMFGRERLEFAVEELPDGSTAADVIDRVGRATQRLRDDVAVCLIRTGDDAPAGTVRVEELEVTWSDLRTERLQRFFEACGVRAGDAAAAVRAASPHLAGLGSVLLRVRMAKLRPGVDVVPVAPATGGADVVPVRRGR